MRKIHPALTAIALLATLTAGCGSGSSGSAGSASAATYENQTSNIASATAVASVTSLPADTQAEAADTSIILGDSVIINGTGAEAAGQQVLISSPGTYRLSGILEDGSVTVNVPGEYVKLVLEGVSIHNPSGPAIQIHEASKSVITLADLTVNTLEGTAEDSSDAVLLSLAPLTIQGSGYLNIDGQYEQGIAAKGQLNITDGILHLSSKGTGISLQAGSATDQTAAGISISGGYVYVDSGGASIQSAGSIDISGGTLIALDGLKENSGGDDAAGVLTITGGTVIAAGTAVPAAADGSAQRSVLIGYDSLQAAGTLAVLQSGDEKLLAFAPAKAYRQLLYSSASLSADTELAVKSGGTATGEAADGLYSSTAYTSGTAVASAATVSASGGQVTATGQQDGAEQADANKEDS